MQRNRRWSGGSVASSIVLKLRPSGGLGDFSLGMPISDAITHINEQSSMYGDCDLKYYFKDTLKLDIVLSFPRHGFHLRFDPWLQRLRLIEVIDIKRLQISYNTGLIGGLSTLATFETIYALFGPTYPGIYDKRIGTYTLFYPGLSFTFPIPSQYAECFHDQDIPLEFPDGTTPVACRVLVYDNSNDSKVGIGSLMTKARVPPLPDGSHYMEEVQVKLGEKLWFRVGGQCLYFGDTLQDVLSELGEPSQYHQKLMIIHSPSDCRPQTNFCGDYFCSYYTRGMDILFDGKTHKIKKFILHTNHPAHAAFNVYLKCNFLIHCSNDGEPFQQGTRPEKCVITPSTKWDQVKGILGVCGQPAIQTQGPFESTYVYGFLNVVFEIMKNGYIATMTLFQS